MMIYIHFQNLTPMQCKMLSSQVIFGCFLFTLPEVPNNVIFLSMFSDHKLKYTCPQITVISNYANFLPQKLLQTPKKHAEQAPQHQT